MRCKGSITIFLSLSLTIILSLLFTLLESARLYGLQSHATMESQLMLESQMAQYHLKMYERYGIYLMEANREGVLSLTEMEMEMQNLGMQNLSTGNEADSRSTLNFYELNLTQCHVLQEQLVTDDKGAAFVKLAADRMRSRIVPSITEGLYRDAKDVQQMEADSGNVDDYITQADTALNDLGAANQAANEAGQTSSGEETEEELPEVSLAPDFENPIEYVKDLKNDAILSQVVGSVASVSQQKFSKKNDLLHRDLYEGNYPTADVGATDKLLFREYLLDQFSDYTSPNADNVLQYELEYLICGEESDKENLTKVAEKLLATRELMNYISLHQDPEKVSLASSMAQAIGGISLNPLVIKAIQEGILASWAYAEAVQDVKLLLNGGKIPLYKTSEDWSSNFQKISESTYGEKTESSLGLDYQDYLRMFLYGTADKKLAMRTLNLMEQCIRATEGNGSFRMDCMVSAVTVNWLYEVDPLFFGLYGSGAGWNGNYQIMRLERFSYAQ